MSTTERSSTIDQVDLPDVIRTRRGALGLSQADLARAVDVSPRQIVRYESGEQEPTLRVAMALADALDVSVTELAGGEAHRLDLSGAWFASWQTYKDGVERIDTHGLDVRQQGEYLQLTARRARTVEEGSYTWRGELRLWDGEALMGWYVSTDAAVRSKGTMYLRLHPHGLHAAGRWTGLSYDGDIVTGYGAIARAEADAHRVIEELIDQPGDPWIRSVT